MLVIDQSEYIEDRPVPGPFPDFPMTKREKPWERGWLIISLLVKALNNGIIHVCKCTDFRAKVAGVSQSLSKPPQRIVGSGFEIDKHPKNDLLAAYNSRTGNELVREKNIVSQE